MNNKLNRRMSVANLLIKSVYQCSEDGEKEGYWWSKEMGRREKMKIYQFSVDSDDVAKMVMMW